MWIFLLFQFLRKYLFFFICIIGASLKNSCTICRHKHQYVWAKLWGGGKRLLHPIWWRSTLLKNLSIPCLVLVIDWSLLTFIHLVVGVVKLSIRRYINFVFHLRIFNPILNLHFEINTFLEISNKILKFSFISQICQLAELNPNALFLKVNYDQLKTLCYGLHIHVLPLFRFYRGAEGRLCSFSCTNATVSVFIQINPYYFFVRCFWHFQILIRLCLVLTD